MKMKLMLLHILLMSRERREMKNSQTSFFMCSFVLFYVFFFVHNSNSQGFTSGQNLGLINSIAADENPWENS